jgi:hypothetical protein
MNDSSDFRILGAWLAEWSDWLNLRNSLAALNGEADITDVDPLSSAASREALRNTVRPYGAPILPVGEVRLLSPFLTPGVDRPVNVAVLQEAGEWRLIVPFGPFSVPATPDELLLEDLDGAAKDRFSGGLDVLQVREAVWVTRDQIQKSWSAGLLTAGTIEDAEAVLQVHFNGATLPEELHGRVGARLSRRKSDPRHAYLSGEANLLGGLGGLQPVWIQKSARMDKARALAFAADDSNASADTKVFRVPERGVDLKLLRGAGSDRVVISVFGADGELSTALDGCKIYGIHGSEVAVISDAAAAVSLEQLAGAFGLRTHDGKPLQVVRKV